ncbi:MAG: hypothetical protein JKY32_07120 [Rhizobiales bacterium]|nr:hypothetical protein [Hyphomicrobiales bacterium]
MATISPQRTLANPSTEYLWETAKTVDTILSVELEGAQGLGGAVTATGTFGGATITMQGSIDDVNFFTLKDAFGSNISFTVGGLAEFSTGARYLKFDMSGGTADDVDVIISLRG